MADDYYYPDEDHLPTLLVVLNSIREYPDYLGKNCPYSPGMQAELLSVMKNHSTTEDSAPTEAYLGHYTDKWTAADRERLSLYDTLRQLLDDYSEDDTSERLQTVKTMATVLDKLTEVGERSKWMRQLADFRRCVLEIMETVLTPDQRTEVMTKLRTQLVLESAS